MPLTKHGYGGYHGGLPVLVVGVVIGGLAPEIGSWPLPVVANHTGGTRGHHGGRGFGFTLGTDALAASSRHSRSCVY